MRTKFRAAAHIFVLLTFFVLVGYVRAAVKTTPAATTKTDLGAINESMVDSSVEVEGTVKTITLPREGSKAPVRIRLTDSSGTMNLIVWPDIFDVIRSQSPIDVGTTIHANARVSKYKEDLQLQVRAASDIKTVAKVGNSEPAGEAPAAQHVAAEPAGEAGDLTPVGNITAAMKNQEVTVKASITDIREPRSEKAPYIVTLSQDGAHIPLVFWSDLQAQIKQGLKVGNVVKVKAQVGEHRDTLQIKLRNATDFSVVTAAE